MSIFKEAQVRKLLDHVTEGNITFSQFVESLNTESYKYMAKRSGLVTMMDVVRTLEAFLVHNPHSKNETQIKIKTLGDYMKSQVIEGAKQNLKV